MTGVASLLVNDVGPLGEDKGCIGYGCHSARK